MLSAKENIEKLRYFCENPSDVLILHWARQCIHGNEGGASTPRILAIVIRSLDESINEMFGIHLEAEKAGIPSEELEVYLDLLEENTIEDFLRFAKHHTEKSWVYWSEGDAHIGFSATKHRYKVLKGKSSDASEGEYDRVVERTIPQRNRVNLNSVLRHIYGDGYEVKPVLQNLVKSNNKNIRLKEILTTDEEATEFENCKYTTMSQSLQNKVEYLADIIRKALTKKLKVSKRQFLRKVQNLFSHPIMIAFAWAATIASTLIAIFQ